MFSEPLRDPFDPRTLSPRACSPLRSLVPLLLHRRRDPLSVQIDVHREHLPRLRRLQPVRLKQVYKQRIHLLAAERIAFRRNEVGKAGMEEYGGGPEMAAGAQGSRIAVSSEAEPASAEPFQGKMRCDRGPQTHGVHWQARRDERGARSDALVERDSGGCGRWREQQELSDRRGTRRRPSTAELGGDVLRCGDGPSDAHGPAAAGADGDVDAEDAGEERHPRQARRGSIAELSVQQGGDGGELELAARDEEGQLLGRGFGLVGTRHDGGAQLVVGREHAVIQNGMRLRRRHEGAQPGEKGVGAHLGVGGHRTTIPNFLGGTLDCKGVLR